MTTLTYHNRKRISTSFFLYKGIEKILTIVLAVAIFVGLLWAYYLVFVYNTIKEVAGGTIVVGEVVIEPSTVPESEYEIKGK